MNDKVIKKIMKCLALAKSGNSNESAIALRQAQKLMEKYGVTKTDVMIAEVNEYSVTTARTSRPPYWLICLADLINDSFGVTHFHSEEWGSNKYVFIGVGPAPEVAAYTFTILRRQLTRARKEHIKSRCGKRGKQSTRSRKGDLFAQAFISSIRKKVEAFAMPVKTKKAIDKYMAIHHKDITTYTKNSAHHKKGDIDSLMHGHAAGEKINLRYGMNGEGQKLINNNGDF